VVRLLGVRKSSAALGLGLLAASLGVLGAGSNGPAPTRYEVTAELLLANDGKVYACYAYLQSFPPAACGGIEVLGVDLSQIRSVEGYPSGGQGSRPQRLVGTWDGQALTLTEPPHPAEKALGLPLPCQQELGFEGAPGMPLMAQVVHDWEALRARGIDMLETVPCDSTTVGIVLVAADDQAVAWLTSHYRPIKVVGWLRPLPSGP
jgi:hypothetical protein